MSYFLLYVLGGIFSISAVYYHSVRYYYRWESRRSSGRAESPDDVDRADRSMLMFVCGIFWPIALPLSIILVGVRKAALKHVEKDKLLKAEQDATEKELKRLEAHL